MNTYQGTKPDYCLALLSDSTGTANHALAGADSVLPSVVGDAVSYLLGDGAAAPVSVGSAFFLGMIIDLIEGSTLGVHALSLSIVTYLVSFRHQLLRNMALWQQSLVIMVLSVLMQFFVFWSEFLLSDIVFHPEVFWNSLVNGILWPWIFLLLRKTRRHFSVH